MSVDGTLWDKLIWRNAIQKSLIKKEVIIAFGGVTLYSTNNKRAKVIVPSSSLLIFVFALLTSGVLS